MVEITMPVEHNTHQSFQIEETHSEEMGQMQAMWQALPEAHQVALALQFVDTIMNGEYRPYFLHLMAQKWPLKTTELEGGFPRIEISEDDLLRANLDEEEIDQLTEEHLLQVSEIMRSHYIHDLFWPEVQHLARVFSETLTE